ncbi:SIFamide-related peptide [Phymastichus coffea]|uniref:SIFamide-related peptide n=1 Tax=Phymastichus coffea TaxID=108790 RepID=UPI00273A99AB|nr:SIFamide-related peptide [Phymastichus coffea]
MFTTRFAILLIVALIITIINVDAAYRKPPFNGSIFGKRANSISGNHYDMATRAMDAICEIARDNCNSWYSHQDSN